MVGGVWDAETPRRADGVVVVSLGYGRKAGGSVLTGTGFNAYAIRSSEAPCIDTISPAQAATPQSATPLSRLVAALRVTHQAAVRHRV